MCLVLIGLDSHRDYSVILAANRDEFYDRPTASAAFWTDAPSVLAGRDLKAGGTWLGVDRRGRLAAVTNYRQGRREDAAPRSRGRLVSDYLTGEISAREHLSRVKREANLYNGFNLIAGDAGGFFYYSNRDDPVRELEPGVYGLSNHLLDTPWPKVTSSKGAFDRLLKAEASELTSGLFALLSDRSQAADELLPSTGVGAEWERLLSSAFIASDGYGTRSSTVILIARDGRIRFMERSFEAGGKAGKEVTVELRAHHKLEGAP